MFEESMPDDKPVKNELKEAIEAQYYKDRIKANNIDVLQEDVKRLQMDKEELHKERFDLAMKLISTMENFEHAQASAKRYREEASEANSRTAELDYTVRRYKAQLQEVRAAQENMAKKFADTLQDRDRWMEEATKGQDAIRELKEKNTRLQEDAGSQFIGKKEWEKDANHWKDQYDKLRGMYDTLNARNKLLEMTMGLETAILGKETPPDFGDPDAKEAYPGQWARQITPPGTSWHSGKDTISPNLEATLKAFEESTKGQHIHLDVQHIAAPFKTKLDNPTQLHEEDGDGK